MLIEILATMLCSVSNYDYNRQKSIERNVPICNRNVSSATKNTIYRLANIQDRQGYCINHLIPLAIGGSNHIDNLEAMKVDNNGQCHSENELQAINCFLNKECTQEESFSLLFSEMDQ